MLDPLSSHSRLSNEEMIQMADATYNDPPPDPFLEYLRRTLHTGRGTGHVNALTDTIVPAFALHPLIQPLVSRAEICYFAGARQGDRGIDCAFGTPAEGATFDSGMGMLRGDLEATHARGRYTSVMTEHSKAQRNRRKDLTEFARDIERIDPGIVRFGICPVNASADYFTWTGKRVNSHGDGPTKAARVLDILRSVPLRQAPGEEGLDALWTPVVSTNNAELDDEREVSWVCGYPQPADGQRYSWSWFIDSLATAYVDRAGG